MTSDTAPTPIHRPAAHRRGPDLPVWVSATRPLLLGAIAVAAGLVVACLGLFVVTVLGALISLIVG